MTSYIIGVESQGHQSFKEKIPTIFQIQDYIEKAWDLGLNAQGRIETGGIRGTRKYIGTPDVSNNDSMFLQFSLRHYRIISLTTWSGSSNVLFSGHSVSALTVPIIQHLLINVSCDAQGFKPKKGSSQLAHELLFQAVERYFTDGCTNYDAKVRCTLLPPIYFQHPGKRLSLSQEFPLIPLQLPFPSPFPNTFRAAS